MLRVFPLMSSCFKDISWSLGCFYCWKSSAQAERKTNIYCQIYVWRSYPEKVCFFKFRGNSLHRFFLLHMISDHQFRYVDFFQIDRHVTYFSSKRNRRISRDGFSPPINEASIPRAGYGPGWHKVAQCFFCRRGGTSNPFHGNDSDSHSELATPWGWVERANLIGKMMMHGS